MRKRKLLGASFAIVILLTLPLVSAFFESNNSLGISSFDAPAIIAGVSNGQPYINKTYDLMTDYEKGVVVLELDDGSFVIGGSGFYGSNYFLLTKTDEYGNHVWTKVIGDTHDNKLYSVIECDDGGFALLGITYNFPVPETYLDILLVRTDSSGNQLWNETYGGPHFDFATDIIELDDGFMIGGTYTSDSNFEDFWLIRTNETGSVEWEKTYGNTNDEHCWSFISTSDGGYVMCGENSSSGCILKLDSYGNATWSKTYSASYGVDIIEVTGGGYAIAGAIGINMLLLRTDADGNHLWNSTWSRPILHSAAYSLVETYDNGFVLVGTCHSPEFLSFQTGVGTVWLLKTDSTGVVEWDHYLGKVGDDSTFVSKYGDGGYILTGETSGTIFLWVIPELNWVQTPIDQEVSATSDLAYQLEAISAADPLSWQVNDTDFLISAEGLLENATLLDAGMYGLNIAVTDAMSNSLSAEITVTVSSGSTTTTTTTTTNTTGSTTGGDSTLILLVTTGIGGVVVLIVIGVLVKKRGG